MHSCYTFRLMEICVFALSETSGTLEELYTVAEYYYFHLCPEIPSEEALNIHIAITLGKQHDISHAGFGQLQIYCG